MARLPLSVRLRRAFEREQPKVQLDDTLAGYFAAMLEDDEECDEENIVEVWSSYLVALLEPEGACKELCLSVLKHLKACEAVCSAANSPQLSRAGSLNPAPAPGATVEISITEVETSPTEEPEEVEGLGEWLEKLSLSHYAVAAREWCSGMGAATVEEIEENWEEFGDAMNLKFLERRRLKLCAAPVSEAATSQARDHADAEEEAEESHSHWVPGNLTASPEAERPFVMSSCSSKRGELHSFGDPDNPYTILKELGHGMTATVYKCRRDDQIFAVKAIGLSRCVRPALPCCIMCISCVNTALARKGCRCSATKKRPWNDCAESLPSSSPCATRTWYPCTTCTKPSKGASWSWSSWMVVNSSTRSTRTALYQSMRQDTSFCK